MGITTTTTNGDEEQSLIPLKPLRPPPTDRFHLAYIVYFTLGIGFLIPWNAYITAVDYFTYLYPSVPVDRVFSVAYMFCGFFFLLLVIFFAYKTNVSLRINAGLGLFVVSLLIPPLVDWVYVKGKRGVHGGYDLSVVGVMISGIADALVQSGVIGSAGELPEIYMQAVAAGTATSGVLISVLRIITKAVYPQDPDGLRKSANLYFAVSIVIIVMCIFCYNLGARVPIVQYYNELKNQAIEIEKEEKGSLETPSWKMTLWEIISSVKSFGFGLFLIYTVTLSIFPGFITEDVESLYLKDWYPVILITVYNVFDLIGKTLPAVYAIQNANIAVGASAARLLFYPLFLGCLHGPEFFRTEVPVTILTCLLGLTNGYLTSILLMLAPKAVPIQHSEFAGIAIVLFLLVGLVSGSVVSWFWVI